MSASAIASIADEPVIAKFMMKKSKLNVMCFEWDASPPLVELSLSVVVVTCLAVRVSIPTVIFPIDQKIFDDLSNIRSDLNALCFAVIIAHFKIRVHLLYETIEGFKCFHGASGGGHGWCPADVFSIGWG